MGRKYTIQSESVCGICREPVVIRESPTSIIVLGSNGDPHQCPPSTLVRWTILQRYLKRIKDISFVPQNSDPDDPES